ncbi:MAG: hypothetical protein JJT89_00615 [Nitriliruptoraceae bacterium]|nr:hypothetical protein [Nitriliruptoraceae bacterium]
MRHRHRRDRWDAERTSEDVPSLSVTIALTLAGGGVLLLAWQLAALPTAVAAGALLVWSVLVELSGHTVSTRVHTGPRRLAWTLLRPAYVVGFGLLALLEALLELVIG